MMKRLINFSGPLVEARGHAHAGPGNERDARAYTDIPLVYTWPVGYAERRTVSQRSSSASYHAPLSTPFPHPADRPFRSIPFRVFIFARVPPRLLLPGYSSLQRSTLVRTADATHTTVRTPEALFCATFDKVELPCDTVSPCSRLNGAGRKSGFECRRRTISRRNSLCHFSFSRIVRIMVRGVVSEK